MADTLGSTSTVLNSAGAVLESEKYYPYGAPRSGGITLTDKKFTGQQDEGTSFGLYDYGARFYSTLTGRFTSPDPVAPKLGNPQTIDRYAYAIDNPLLYTDPTGLEPYSDLHRLADAINQQRFIAWGRAIMGAGVTASRVGDMMQLIQEAHNADPSQDIYIVHCGGVYLADQPVFEDLPEGDWPPDTEIEYADQVGIQTGTENSISGFVDINAVVAIPHAGPLGLSTGTITVLCDYTPSDRSPELRLGVTFSNGEKVDALYVPAKAQTVSFWGRSTYSFTYQNAYGRPSNLVVNLGKVHEWTYSPRNDKSTLVTWQMGGSSLPPGGTPLVPVPTVR